MKAVIRWTAVICLVASVAHAQSEGASADAYPEYSDYDKDKPAQTRRLHDHVFLFPILQPTSFVTTDISLNVGAAVYDVTNVPVGRLGTRDITLSGVQQRLDAGFRIVEWLGLFGRVGVVAITGVDAESIVIEGVSVNATGEAGVVARVFKNDKMGTQLGVRGSFSYSAGEDLPILSFVQTVSEQPIDSIGQVIDGNLSKLLFVPTQASTLVGGLYGAQYINPFLALQLGATFKYSWDKREPVDPSTGARVQEDANTIRVELAAALELSFEPLHVPVALQAEFLQALGNQDNEMRPDRNVASSSVGLGIYYVGRPNLQFGIGTVASLSAEPRRGVGVMGEQEFSDPPTIGYFDLIVRYIW